MTLRLHFDPADTLAVGDGRPFNQDDAGRADAASLFPPPPDTLHGAACVIAAHALGFPEKPWPEGQLGSWGRGGKFSVAGPLFSTDAGGDLLPIPANVVARTDKTDRNRPPEIVVLLPGKEIMRTDIGEVRLLELPTWDDNLKDETLAGRWGKDVAVKKLLSGDTVHAEELGRPPESAWSPKARKLYPNRTPRLPGWGPDDLAAAEPRVGIARDLDTRQVEEGQLYVSVRRRLMPGVSMFVEIGGVELDKNRLEGAIPLGGENRFAFTHAEMGPSQESALLGATKAYLVCFTTPALVKPPMPGEVVDKLPGRLVAAAITGVRSQAGRSRKSGRPVLGKSRPLLPAGSVLFMEGGGEMPACIGDLTHRGYGRFVTGVWKDG